VLFDCITFDIAHDRARPPIALGFSLDGFTYFLPASSRFSSGMPLAGRVAAAPLAMAFAVSCRRHLGCR